MTKNLVIAPFGITFLYLLLSSITGAYGLELGFKNSITTSSHNLAQDLSQDKTAPQNPLTLKETKLNNDAKLKSLSPKIRPAKTIPTKALSAEKNTPKKRIPAKKGLKAKVKTIEQKSSMKKSTVSKKKASSSKNKSTKISAKKKSLVSKPAKVAIPAKKPKISAKIRLQRLMAKKGVQKGNPIFIRIFKQEGDLELWMRSGKRFTLLKTYKVCKSSGRIGPKLAERDYQSPEGFYSVGRSQMKPDSAYYRAFNVGFPNKYDRAWGRTGSLIMVHGACQSVGCFAMTNKVMGEIYTIADAALRTSQKKFDVHIFPFRLTAANIDKYKKHRWNRYWWNLKEGYDMFEHSLLPPITTSRGRRYYFAWPANPKRKMVKTRYKSKKQPAKTIKTRYKPKNIKPSTEDPFAWKKF